jgi:hypothetical protein
LNRNRAASKTRENLRKPAAAKENPDGLQSRLRVRFRICQKLTDVKAGQGLTAANVGMIRLSEAESARYCPGFHDIEPKRRR